MRDVQFPLDEFFDVVKTHGRVRGPGAKGTQSRAIAVFVQTGQCFLAGFGCEVEYQKLVGAASGQKRISLPPFASDISAMQAGYLASMS